MGWRCRGRRGEGCRRARGRRGTGRARRLGLVSRSRPRRHRGRPRARRRGERSRSGPRCSWSTPSLSNASRAAWETTSSRTASRPAAETRVASSCRADRRVGDRRVARDVRKPGEAVVARPPSERGEALVALRERREQRLEIADRRSGRRSEPVGPGVPGGRGRRAAGALHRGGRVGITTGVPASLTQRAVGGEVVGRIVGRRERRHAEAREQRPRRQQRQLPVRLLPDLACRRRAERQLDAEDASKLEVRPDVERVADQARHGRRPRREPLPGVGVARDEPLLDAGQAHGTPLVVVVLEPQLGEVVEDAVAGDVRGRQVVVEVDDRQALGDVVEERARRSRSRGGSRRRGSGRSRVSDRHRAEAAVDHELRARDEPSGVAREQQRRAHQLVRLTEAPQRRVLDERRAPARA